MGIEAEVIISTTTDSWKNLATEELLLNTLDPNTCRLFLYVNSDVVVIGKNQNPWKECRVNRLEHEGCRLARRSSGGGTVFHDTGNLNYSFIMPVGAFDIDRQFGIVLKAMSALGVNAVCSERRDIRVMGDKCSGNAMCYRKSAAMHHGTIMVDVKIPKLYRYLTPSDIVVKTHAVQSIPSLVTNLKKIVPDITIEKVMDAICGSFREEYGTYTLRNDADYQQSSEWAELYEKHRSWEWRFGRTPRYEITMQKDFSKGYGWFIFNVNEGKIVDVSVSGEPFDEEAVQKLKLCWTGKIFHVDCLADSVSQADANSGDDLFLEIEKWLRDKSFNYKEV
ncbi:MAG: lipoate--protein ligase [Candidatus Auribacter fodinae]|jgi:lipoate-protein ligase A|uniref:Lipoate--protein ligase n=1 Tax=Candidatus Auribacter fodinae TaxID=2093366 RepID=A0A3A4R617_9BACT|nr:MAG: lipoate--protein ligase [Candidatus Auribacter fodinae]